MAIHHSTETALPVLEDLSDVVDEYQRLNTAFECYHELVTSLLYRCVNRQLDEKSAKRFVTGLDTLFYSTLARSEKVSDFVYETVHASRRK